MIRAVFFDIGETLVDETASWGSWADWLGVPRMTFFAALGIVIERGQHHSTVFELVAPGVDIEAERARRTAAGRNGDYRLNDFYPDALACLESVRRSGRLLGLAGNQPERTESTLANLGIEADVIASSARWGVEKPSPGFFDRIHQAADCARDEIAYVGDRVDNDVVPSHEAGMRAVFLRRGPWAMAQMHWSEAACADATVDSLELVAPLLRQW